MLANNFTEANDRLCQSRLLSLPCGLLFAPPFVNLINSDQMSTHGSCDTRRCQRVHCAEHHVSSRPLKTSPGSHEPFTLLEWPRHLGGSKKSTILDMNREGLDPQSLYVRVPRKHTHIATRI